MSQTTCLLDFEILDITEVPSFHPFKFYTLYSVRASAGLLGETWVLSTTALFSPIMGKKTTRWFWLDHLRVYRIDSDDDFCSRCRNISQGHHNSASQDYTHPDDRSSPTLYDMTPGFKLFVGSIDC